MSFYLLWCDTDLYKWNIVTEQSENNHCLKRVSVQSKLLLINHKNRIDINVCQSKSDNISIVQNESSTSCQLRDTYLYDTYMMIVVVVVAAVLVIQKLVLKYLIKEDFTYKRWWWRSWRRKKKRFEKKDEGIYNSLHWQINWSELLKKTMCWQEINFFFICKPYLYEAVKHVSTDNDNCTTIFSDT